MEKFVINGGLPLRGTVDISGAKNAAVAIIPACILVNDVCIIENIPNIADVSLIIKILYELGAKVKTLSDTSIQIDTRTIKSHIVPYELTKRMRASCYFMGSMLGRFSKARIGPSGGCDFGVRPIEQHIKGFEALGAAVTNVSGMIDVSADRLMGSLIYLDQVSVGATVNILLASVRARGMTVIENAAREPHIVDLVNFLNSCGADIRGAGTDTIKVRGVETLHGTTYSIIPDQIEAGTYMVAAAATGGDVLVNNVIPKHLESIIAKLEEAGATIEINDESVRVIGAKEVTRCNIKTQPHPGFPTDMQPQMAVLLCLANGTSIISEGVWDNRFRYADQLNLMGAQIQVDGKVSVIEGVDELTGAPVLATDLRAGAAMVIAGLAAKGKTEIEDIIYIDRGYENIVEKISALGGDIKRVTVRTPNDIRKAE